MKRLIKVRTFVIGTTSFRVETYYNPWWKKRPEKIEDLKEHNSVKVTNIKTK